MKKILVLLIALVVLLTLTACGKDAAPPTGITATPTTGTPPTTQAVTPPTTVTATTVPAQTVPPHSDMIVFSTLTLDGKSVNGEVANEITTFSFFEEIEVSEGVEYTVSLDIYGRDVVPTKTVALYPGDNTFYVLATSEDYSKVYTVTIRRRPIYNVYFATNGGSSIKKQAIEEGGRVIIPDNPTKVGYTFIGWNYSFENAVMSDLVIDAQWAANTYEITYDANGGAVSQYTQIVNYGSSYTLETPTRKGYTFAGWYYGEKRYYGGTWNELSNVALKAKWNINTYNIFYVNNGGVHSNPTTYTIEDEIELAAPTKTGYTFLGWTYDGQPTPVLNAKISKGSTANMKYTANWRVNSYEITYDANGGSVTKNTQTVSYGDWFSLEAPTRTGYTFAGWYDGETAYYSGTWRTLNNVTLKAKWNINSYYVSVTGTNGGSVNGEGLYEYNSTATVSAKSKLGYTWLGWYDTNNNIVSTKTTYSFTIGDSNVALIAKWKISDDIADFEFFSTETTCTITDVLDNTKSTYTIPTYVTSIGEWAFFMCDYLTSITIPNGVTSIGAHAFGGCNNLSYIELPNSITIIGESSFSSCNALTSFVIPENVTSISEHVFSSCDNLTSVIVHRNVTFIGQGAFSGCTKLASITFGGSTSEWNTISFGSYWNHMVPTTIVICSNGTVTLS